MLHVHHQIYHPVISFSSLNWDWSLHVAVFDCLKGHVYTEHYNYCRSTWSRESLHEDITSTGIELNSHQVRFLFFYRNSLVSLRSTLVLLWVSDSRFFGAEKQSLLWQMYWVGFETCAVPQQAVHKLSSQVWFETMGGYCGEGPHWPRPSRGGGAWGRMQLWAFLKASAPTPGSWKTASVHSFKEISRRSFKVQKQTNPEVG